MRPRPLFATRTTVPPVGAATAARTATAASTAKRATIARRSGSGVGATATRARGRLGMTASFDSERATPHSLLRRAARSGFARLTEAAVRREQLEDLVLPEGRRDVAVSAGDLRSSPERIQHRLLGRIDGGGEDGVERGVGDDFDGDPGATLLARPPAGRREREEDLAAAVRRRRARASQ